MVSGHGKLARLDHARQQVADDRSGRRVVGKAAARRPASAAGFGLLIVAPASGTSLAVMDQWVRPRAGKEPQAGLAVKAIPYPNTAGPATSQKTVRPRQHSAKWYSRCFSPRPSIGSTRDDWPSRSKRIGKIMGGWTRTATDWPRCCRTFSAKYSEHFVEIQSEFCRLLPLYRGISFRQESLRSKKAARSGKPPIEQPRSAGLYLETCSGRHRRREGRFIGHAAVSRPVDAGAFAGVAAAVVDREPGTWYFSATAGGCDAATAGSDALGRRPPGKAGDRYDALARGADSLRAGGSDAAFPAGWKTGWNGSCQADGAIVYPAHSVCRFRSAHGVCRIHFT